MLEPFPREVPRYARDDGAVLTAACQTARTTLVRTGLAPGPWGAGSETGVIRNPFRVSTRQCEVQQLAGVRVEPTMRPLAPPLKRQEFATYLPYPNPPFNCLTVPEFKA